MSIRKTVWTIATSVIVLAPSSVALAAGGGGGTAAGADIQVTGSASTGSPAPTQTYTYTYQVKNSGPQDATSTSFTDDLTAGGLVYAAVNGFTSPCSHSSDGAGGTAITCNLFTIAKGGQATVTVSVTAPTTIGSFANTGTATSADLVDPQPANNSTTVTVKVGSAACPLPADQPTISGVVAWKFYDSNGFLAGFHMYGNDGVQYTVLMNLFATPLTNTINLLCKAVPANLYIQVTNTDSVTGTVDMEVLPGDTVASPVIHASVVQTPYWVDKVA